jgi:hypothetical protein
VDVHGEDDAVLFKLRPVRVVIRVQDGPALRRGADLQIVIFGRIDRTVDEPDRRPPPGRDIQRGEGDLPGDLLLLRQKLLLALLLLKLLRVTVLTDAGGNPKGMRSRMG